MQILKAGALYFALVFGAGFVLGTIRTLWLVPTLGTRSAELLEMPAMLVVVVLSARWIVRRLGVLPRTSARLGVGFTALGLLVGAEFTLVLWLRRLTLEGYLTSRDPIAGAVYLIMLGVFAFMPLLVGQE